MDKWKKGLIWAAGIALLIALRRAVGRIALLLLVASTLAYLLLPLEHVFRQRLRLARGPASALAFASAALALLLLMLFGAPALLRQAAALGQRRRRPFGVSASRTCWSSTEPMARNKSSFVIGKTPPP